MENKVIVDVYYSGRNFSAHAPLLPGCAATGATLNVVKQNIKEAIELHVKSSIEDGDEIAAIFNDTYELDYHFAPKGI